jgi:hypothetical protein
MSHVINLDSVKRIDRIVTAHASQEHAPRRATLAGNEVSSRDGQHPPDGACCGCSCTHVQASRAARHACTCVQPPPSPQGAVSGHDNITLGKLCAVQSHCPLRRIICAMSHARSARPCALKGRCTSLCNEARVYPPPTQVLRTCGAQHPSAPRGSPDHQWSLRGVFDVAHTKTCARRTAAKNINMHH